MAQFITSFLPILNHVTMSCVKHEDCYSTPMVEEVLKEGKEHRQNDHIITAGFLIGLGAGLFVDHVVSGILIGIGLGFLGSELLPLVSKHQEGEYPQPGGTNVTNFLIGAFLIFIGIGIVWAPDVIWPNSIAGFLILTGIWFLVRGIYKIS